MDVIEALEVGPAWAGHPVGFALLTSGERQYVAFYDEDRALRVASRELSGRSWHFTKLPVTTDWDSHRYITMAVDRGGHLHLACNMHNSPLVYFRMSLPHDAESLRGIHEMVGHDEGRCTYPRFFRGPDDALVFTYRDGSSGNGTQLFNVYDEGPQSWRRLIDGPLIDGEGQRGVYVDRFRPPFRGPDGFFHLCWVWRESSDPSTTHSPSYMRSRDLVTWETGSGAPLALPVTLATADVVDPVPIRGGIINGNICVSADHQGRPIVSYHKFDEAGNTQIYDTRHEGDHWRVHQVSEWDYRWDFGGGGTIPFEIRIGPVLAESEGVVCQAWQHVRYGGGRWLLDGTTLRVTSLQPDPAIRASDRRARARLLGLVMNKAEDLGQPPARNGHFVLEWETLAANRDHQRENVLFATMLRVHQAQGRPSQLTGYSDVPTLEG
jgi:hypothetical protein